MGKSGERDGGVVKTAIVVAGGLALAWLAVETAFKPFLDRVRGAINRSDPARDPDDDDPAAARTAPPKEASDPDPVLKDEEEKDGGVKSSD